MPQLRPRRLNLRIPLAIVIAFIAIFQFAGVKSAAAAVLFEGWSKVQISGKHVGYIVQRYEFDEKKKEFREIHFLKTTPDAGGLTESLVARADSSFKPIAYQYTGMTGDKPILIDATFKGGKLVASVTEGKEKKTVTTTLPPKAILSTFLGYVMLQGKEGLKKGIKYSYDAILEESALLSKDNEAYIAEEETVSGIPVFRILNKIKVNGSQFISLVTHKAEILGTVSPSQGVQTVLVATMEEAVAGFGMNNAALVRLFGAVPKGKENEIARQAAMPKAAASPAAKTSAPSAPAAPSPTPAAGK